MFLLPGSRAQKNPILRLGAPAVALTGAQQAQAQATIAATPIDALMMNNMLINGAMDVSQANVGSVVTGSNNGNTYIVDQWQLGYNHAANTAVITGQQVGPPGTASFGSAFANCMQVKATTALTSPASGDFAYFLSPIESVRTSKLSFGSSAGRPVTVAFWVYATIAGTATVNLRNGGTTRTYVSNVQINNPVTWEYKTVTIPPDQTGTWTANASGVGIYFSLALAAGTTLQGANNSWNAGNFVGTSTTTNFLATNNNLVALTGVVAVAGTQAPPAARSPFIMRPFDEELPRCMRYYEKSFTYATVPAQNAGTQGALYASQTVGSAAGMNYVYLTYKVPKRSASNSIITYNPQAANAQFRNFNNATDCSALAVAVSDESSLAFSLTSAAGSAAGNGLGVHWTVDSRM